MRRRYFLGVFRVNKKKHVSHLLSFPSEQNAARIPRRCPGVVCVNCVEDLSSVRARVIIVQFLLIELGFELAGIM